MRPDEPEVFVMGASSRQQFVRRTTVGVSVNAVLVVLLLVFRQWIWAGLLLLIVAYGVWANLRRVRAWTMITDEGLTASRIIGWRFIPWSEITEITDCGRDFTGGSYRALILTTTRWPKKRRLSVPFKPNLGREREYDEAVARIHETWATQTNRPTTAHPGRTVRHYSAGGYRWTTEE